MKDFYLCRLIVALQARHARPPLFLGNCSILYLILGLCHCQMYLENFNNLHFLCYAHIRYHIISAGKDVLGLDKYINTSSAKRAIFCISPPMSIPVIFSFCFIQLLRGSRKMAKRRVLTGQP